MAETSAPGESAWGIKPGMAWAEEVEAEEAKHGPLTSEEAFPSLGEAVKAPPKAKKKPVKMQLGAFQAAGRRQPTDAELLAQLPKGSSGLPKEERESSALGGAFRDYGGNRDGFRGRRDGDERDEREPSRADAASDWGAERKFVPTDSSRSGGSFGSGGFGGRDRDRDGGSGGFGDRPPRGERPVSEADTADDWGANRKFTPSADSGRGGGGGGGGGFGGGSFRDRPPGGAGRPFSDEPSRADAGDWGSRRAPPAPEGGDRGLGPSASRRGYGFEQPVSQADTEDRWSHKPQPAGDGPSSSGAPAGERPRLKLAPRTLPLPDIGGGQQQQQPAAAAANGVGPSPAGSDAGSSSSGQQAADKPRRSNPFGDARPREEVLKEKGIDYQKEELKLEHGEVIRDATPEEQEMEKEVEGMRQQLEELNTSRPDETDTISALKKELDEKERALYTLQAKLDDEVRYSKHRPSDRDGGPPRGSSGAAQPEDTAGFEPVRNARKERAAAAAPGEGGAKQEEGGEAGAGAGGGAPAAPAPVAGGSGGGAWGRGGGGGGSFRDSRDGPRGGGSFRDREAPRDGPPRDGPPRERRANESLAGRTAGGW